MEITFMNEYELNKDVREGIHPYARQKVLAIFDKEEQKIIENYANKVIERLHKNDKK